MKTTQTTTVNAIALEVMQAANMEKEDHSKTLELLRRLQLAINDSRVKAS